MSSTQYAAHREDFRRRYKDLDERQLFHGCSSVSADQIITSCFNRTFAGINGKSPSSIISIESLDFFS